MLKTKWIWFSLAIPLSMLFINCSGGFEVLDSTKSGSTSSGAISDASSDPLVDLSWHLSNLGQSAYSAASGLAGNDLALTTTWGEGIYGSGIKVLVSDDGVESTHEDLDANFIKEQVSKDYTLSYPYLSYSALPKGSDDNHGTSVAGIISAVGWNGLGSRGVAPKSTFAVANFLSSAVTQTTAVYIDQINGAFDVFSMSWGASQDSLYDPDTSFEAQLKYGVTSLRSGLGAIYVKAAGNEYYTYCNGSTSDFCIGNSNFDADNTNPYLIMVGALNSQGTSSSYSSPGSNLWISGFGGEYGSSDTTYDKAANEVADSATIMTTDRSGCSAGYAESSASGAAFEKGQTTNNAGCNYTSGFNGTSAATPTISGAVALILSANPNLTWRDVRYILAKTATKVDSSRAAITVHPLEFALPSGLTWEQGWVTNAAGFSFHNWYGFGRVNVDAAVAMAKSYSSSLGTLTNSAFADTSGAVTLSIPDNSATGATSTIPVSRAMTIEAVRIKLWATHPYASDLQVELTSPSGTKSILINARNSLGGIANFQGETFLSNAFYGESTTGNWTLKVIDGARTDAGTLTRWTLDFSGH